MGSSDNPELQTLASMCLENLSFNSALQFFVEKYR